MFDLWYATGAAIMFPQMLDDVISKSNAISLAAGRPAGAPLFYHSPTIQFCDGQNPNVPIKNPNIGDPVAATAPIIQDAGFIVSAIIDDIRGAIKDTVHQWFPFAPPISLYTAGKFCQILTVPAFDIKNNISLANQGYQTAVQNLPAKRSPNFPAFLGVYLMDSGLTTSMAGGSPSVQEALAEFQITDPGEISAFAALAKPGKFLKAQSNLLGGVAGAAAVWTHCREQFLAWSPETDGMVI